MGQICYWRLKKKWYETGCGHSLSIDGGLDKSVRQGNYIFCQKCGGRVYRSSSCLNPKKEKK